MRGENIQSEEITLHTFGPRNTVLKYLHDNIVVYFSELRFDGLNNQADISSFPTYVLGFIEKPQREG